MKQKDYVLEQFRKDTADHQLEVILDQGMHRHLRLSKPGTSCYSYNVVTWPGYLAVSGDMGGSIFTRLPDMFEFFREKPRQNEPDALYINQSYWAEKLHANDGDPKRYESGLLRELVKRKYDEFLAELDPPAPDADAEELWSDLEDRVLGAETIEEAIAAMSDFEREELVGVDEFRFHDAWEYASQLTDYEFGFTWRLYAIAHAIRLYDTRVAPVTFTYSEPSADS